MKRLWQETEAVMRFACAVQVEVVTPLEEMLTKYEEAHPGEQEVDQVRHITPQRTVERLHIHS